MNTLGISAAFVGGFLSFISPCVLPLLPGYLSFITGVSVEGLTGEGEAKAPPLLKVLIPSLLFVAGFSLVFVIFGASASLIGSWLLHYRDAVRIVGGVLIIVFGVITLEVIKIPGLYREMRFNAGEAQRFGKLKAFVIGIAFAAGWTPCVGPILGSILGLAGSTQDVGQGAFLLLVYSAGLAIPFLLIAVFFSKTRPLILWLQRHSRVIRIVSGVILIITGALIATDTLTRIVFYVTKFVPVLG